MSHAQMACSISHGVQAKPKPGPKPKPLPVDPGMIAALRSLSIESNRNSIWQVTYTYMIDAEISNRRSTHTSSYTQLL